MSWRCGTMSCAFLPREFLPRGSLPKELSAKGLQADGRAPSAIGDGQTGRARQASASGRRQSPHCSVVSCAATRSAGGPLLVLLPEGPRLEREDVVQHPVHAAALQTVIRN